jgi:hypothetical protein
MASIQFLVPCNCLWQTQRSLQKLKLSYLRLKKVIFERFFTNPTKTFQRPNKQKSENLIFLKFWWKRFWCYFLTKLFLSQWAITSFFSSFFRSKLLFLTFEFNYGKTKEHFKSWNWLTSWTVIDFWRIFDKANKTFQGSNNRNNKNHNI